MAERKETPRRYRDARADGTVGSLEKTIEGTFGLPPGSIKVVNPNGRDARSDKEVGTLRKDHEARKK